MELFDIKFIYTRGSRGWEGDVPRMRLDIEKIKAIGWKPTYTSENSESETMRAFLEGDYS